MNQPLSFSNLGKSIIQENKDAQDYLTLQLLNNYSSPKQFASVNSSQDRLIKQVEKQSQLIQELFSKMKNEKIDSRLSPRNYNSDQYSPYFEQQPRQPLISYMPPLPPPPIFIPQNFSFLQKQEMERQQQEKLRMLLLMKKLREENNELKMKLLAKGDQSEKSYSQEISSVQSSSSRNTKQHKQQSKPKGPSQQEINKEQEILQQLINKRAQMQLKVRCKRLLLMLNFIRRTKWFIEQKASQFTEQFPQTILKFQSEISLWMSNITNSITTKLKQAKNLMLYLEAKTNPNEQKKRMELLKTYAKNYIDVIFDNKDSFPEFCTEYLIYFTHNYYTTPPNFFLKFELSRLTFTTKGGTIVDKRKGQMMLMTIIFLRMYLQFISEIWEPCPAHLKAAEQKLNQQFLLNIQAICSVIHLLVVDELRGLIAVQPDNLKYIPLELQPKAKSGGVIRIKNFQEREIDKQKLEQLKQQDEPLAYPLLDKSEVLPFFSDNASIEMIKSILEGWSEDMYQIVDQCQKNKILQRKKQFEDNEKKIYLQQISKCKDMTNANIQLRQQGIMIAEQREKIRQMKHYMNLPTQTNRNTSYEQSKTNLSQQPSSRRQKQ